MLFIVHFDDRTSDLAPFSKMCRLIEHMLIVRSCLEHEIYMTMMRKINEKNNK